MLLATSGAKPLQQARMWKWAFAGIFFVRDFLREQVWREEWCILDQAEMTWRFPIEREAN